MNFSVVVPTHNRPHLVGRAVKSAILNLVAGDEILVIDDGSSASYDGVFDQFDPRIVKYHRIANGGVSAARNAGMKLALNPYIAFLDDDDEWLENHLELQRKVFLEHPALAGIFCNFRTTDDQGHVFHDGVASWSIGKPQITGLLSVLAVEGMPQNTVVYAGDHYRNQLSTDYILPSSFSINTQAVGRQNRFKVGLKRNQTYLFNSHICSLGSIAYIDCETCIQHGDAPVRATGIHEFDNVFSRLIVMSEEWGSNSAFLAQNKALFEKVFLMDFAVAFKVALRELSFSRLKRLLDLTGFFNFSKYALRSLPLLLDRSKIERRIT